MMNEIELNELNKRVEAANKKFIADTDVMTQILGLARSGLSWKEVMEEVGTFPELGRVWIENCQQVTRSTRDFIAAMFESFVEDLDHNLKECRKDGCYPSEDVVSVFRTSLVRLKEEWGQINVG